MHSHAPHRPKIIAAASDEAHEHRPATPRDLSRLVSHFRNIRASTKDRAAKESNDADDQDMIAPLPEYVAPPADLQREGEGAGGESKDEDEAEDQSTAAADNPIGSLEDRPAATASLTPGVAMSAGESVRRVRAANAHGAVQRQTAAGPQLGTRRAFDAVIESIVERIDEFCSEPAVLEFGDWKMNVPLNGDVLPNCSLTVGLSRFDLMLRFETLESRSANLIYSNQPALRQSLSELMQAWPSGPRDIDITVI